MATTGPARLAMATDRADRRRRALAIDASTGVPRRETVRHGTQEAG